MRGMGVLGFFGSCGARCVAADKCFAGDFFVYATGEPSLWNLRKFSICNGRNCNLTKC